MGSNFNIRHGKKFYYKFDHIPEESKNAQIFFKYGAKEHSYFMHHSDYVRWFFEYKVECKKKRVPFMLYEYITDNTAICFYCDIEGYSDPNISPGEHLNIQNAILDAFTEVYESMGQDTSKIVFMEDHRIGKRKVEKGSDIKVDKMKTSFHALCNDILFTETASAKAFAVGFNKLLSEKVNSLGLNIDFGEEKDVLDMCVYHHKRGMRTEGSQKDSTSKGFTLCERSKHASIEDRFITKNIPREQFHNKMFSKLEPVKKQVKPRVPKETTSKNEGGTILQSASRTEYFEKKIQEHFLEEYGRDQDIKVKYMGYDGDGYHQYRLDGNHRYCLSCLHHHTSNGSVLTYVEDELYTYNCLVPDMPSSRLMIPKVLAPSRKLEYCVTEDNRVPSYKDDDTKCIDIRAGMGTGKTYQYEKRLEVKSDASVLGLSSRVSVAKTMVDRLKLFGFEIYLKTKNAHRWICEYESLNKLTKLPDIVTLDEFRSILKSATCYETNKSNLCAHFDTLVAICKRSKQTLIMCADTDLDGAADTFISDVFGEESVRTIRLEKPFLQRQFTFMHRETIFEQMYRELKEGKRIVACFGSSAVLKSTMKTVEEMIGKDKVTGYFADSPNQHELNDITTHWDKKQFICYTSCITCGLDYSGEIDSGYLFPSIMCSCPRDSLQSVGRFRTLLSKDIFVMLPGSTYYEPLPKNFDFQRLFEVEMEKVMERRSLITSLTNSVQREYMGSILKEYCPDGIKWTPSLLTKIWVYNIVEENLKVNFWYMHFIHIIRKKGYTWKNHPMPSHVLEPKVNLKNMIQDVRDATCRDLDSVDVTDLNDEWERETLVKSMLDTATQTELLCMRKYAVQKHFDVPLSGPKIMFFEKHKRPVVNAIALECLTIQEMRSMYEASMASSSYCDFEKQDFLVLELLERLMKALGFLGLHDYTSTIVFDSETETPEVFKLINEMNIISRGTRRRGESIKSIVAKYMIDYAGLRLKSKQVRRNKLKVRVYFVQKDEKVYDLVDDGGSRFFTEQISARDEFNAFIEKNLEDLNLKEARRQISRLYSDDLRVAKYTSILVVKYNSLRIIGKFFRVIRCLK